MLTNLGFIQCFWDATAHGPSVLRFIVHNYDEKVCELTLLTVKSLPVLNSTQYSGWSARKFPSVRLSVQI